MLHIRDTTSSLGLRIDVGKFTTLHRHRELKALAAVPLVARSNSGALPLKRPKLGTALCALLLFAEAVAQTLNEAAGSFLRVGSEIDHRIRRARCVRPDVVRPAALAAIFAITQQLFRAGFMRQPRVKATVGRANEVSTRPASERSPLSDMALDRGDLVARAPRPVRLLERQRK